MLEEIISWPDFVCTWTMCVSVPRRVPQQFGAHNVILFIPLSLMQKNAIHWILGKKTSNILVIVGSLLEVAGSGQINEQNWDLYTRDIIDEGRMKKNYFGAVCWMINTSFHSASRGQFADKINCFGDWMQSCMEKKKNCRQEPVRLQKIAAFNNTGWGKNKRRLNG